MNDMISSIFMFLLIFALPYGIYELFSLFKIKLLSYLVVILYFLLLALTFLPNFLYPIGSRERPPSVKGNMHTFQTILETYSVDSNGYYPKNVEDLIKTATKGNNTYWKDFKNPYTREKGKGKSYDDFSKVTKKFNFELSKFQLTAKKGCIYYYPVFFDKKGLVNAYVIYGSDKDGELIRDIQTNKAFVLSNN